MAKPYRAERRNAAREAARGTEFHIGQVWRGAPDRQTTNEKRLLPRPKGKYMPHQSKREMERRTL